MVLDGELGVMVLRSERIWEFFQVKMALEKDELMRSVKCGRMEGADNLSMDLSMWSGPVLLVQVELITERTWASVTGE